MKENLSSILCRRLQRLVLPCCLAFAVAMMASAVAAAQPFGPYVSWSGDGETAAANGWLAVPDSPALDPDGAITIEGWFDLATPFATPQAGCRSLVGKDLTQGYWLGVCGSTVQASFGGGAALSAGTVPPGQWTHVAVTWDGTTQTHYVNGEMVGSFPVSGALAPSSAELRIGSDVSWPWSPLARPPRCGCGTSRARSTRSARTINVTLTAPQPGLVAVWNLASAADSLGTYGGTWNGAVTPVPLTPAGPCTASTAAALCLADRFALSVGWRDGSGSTGAGTVVPVASGGSGIFWFFSSDEWEVMVKIIDGCALNSAVWLFSAATTNVFYRLEVADVSSGVTKVYFNYPGPPGTRRHRHHRVPGQLSLTAGAPPYERAKRWISAIALAGRYGSRSGEEETAQGKVNPHVAGGARRGGHAGEVQRGDAVHQSDIPEQEVNDLEETRAARECAETEGERGDEQAADGPGEQAAGVALHRQTHRHPRAAQRGDGGAGNPDCRGPLHRRQRGRKQKGPHAMEALARTQLRP